MNEASPSPGPADRAQNDVAESSRLAELAEHPEAARYLEGSRVELVRPRPAGPAIAHVLFDHDGTISTLREGWERVMSEMMVREILGPCAGDAEEPLLARIRRRVSELIEETTGHQTLVQMRALAEMVRQFALVPPADVLDLHGYKAIYLRELAAMMGTRLADLRAGRRPPADFLIPGAGEFLRLLAGRGVKLYLASGTDVDDVRDEARLLGYADLFEDRIYGAVGDVRVEAKQAVIESILREHSLPPAELAVVGDGPVEIRLAPPGALGIGVASDELHPGRLNPAKRARLIRAGADYIVADFTSAEALLAVMAEA